MLNCEKYSEELINSIFNNRFCEGFVIPYVLKPAGKHCRGTMCDLCSAMVKDFLKLEYKEESVDWSKVVVDTPILVRHSELNDWIPRYFAKYENGVVYAWDGGTTSLTAENEMVKWQHAKLLKEERNQ